MLRQGLKCCAEAGDYRGYGDPKWGLMRIGIAPGDQEVIQGKPFVGPTGELLRDITVAAGWNPAHTFDTNCVCTKHNEPTPSQLEQCRPRLEAEIEVFKPRLIVMYGADVPGRYLLGKASKRGWIYSLTVGSHTCNALWTYHPSAVLQGSNHLVYDILRDTQKIPLILSEQPTTSIRLESYETVTTTARAQEVLNSFKPGEIVALDIETRLHDPNTDDIDIHTDDLLCLAVTNGINTYVFIREACGTREHPLTWPMYVRWLYHNSPFDRAGIRKFLGIDLPVAIDTMYKSSGRDEYTGTATFKRAGQNKLENLTAEYFGDTEFKEKTKKSWRKHVQPNMQDLAERNAKDAFYTWNLSPVLDRFYIQPAYESLVLPASIAYSEICERGAHINMEVHHELAKEWGTAFMKLYVELLRKGVKNPNSSAQLSHYFYDPVEAGGLALAGGPSTAKAVLRDLEHPDALRVVDMRNLNYLLTHWVFKLSDFLKPDKRIHPNIILHGPETGRRAAHEPPIQTIPHHGTRLARLRELFSATNDNYVIVEADYCLDSNTKVLATDLTWMTLDQVEEGGWLIGFDEDITKKRSVCFHPTQIVSKKTVVQPSYRITLENGKSIISSANHLWVGKYTGGTDEHKHNRRPKGSPTSRNYIWIKTKDLLIGDSLRQLCDPWEVDDSKESWYLKGFFDGEGYVASHSVGYGQNDGDTAEYVHSILKKKGYVFNVGYQSDSIMGKYNLVGNGESLRFLGSIRPPRLLKKASRLWNNRSIYSKIRLPLKVVNIEYLGDRELIAIQTDKSTFIAEGLLSHNSQAEMWVARYMSDDQALAKDLETPLPDHDKPDVHLATAIRVGAMEIEGITYDQARQAGKTLNFLMLYGGGAAKLQDTLALRGIPITLSDAERIVREYRAAYSGFSRWADNTWQEARTEGFITTPFGRVRRFPLIVDMSWRSSVINFPIQSIAGDYTLSSLVELHTLFKERGLDAHILFDIHDSIVFEINKACLEEAKILIRQIMEAPKVGLGSIKIDMKEGAHL